MTMHRGLETPACMAGRPVDHRGFPVPWFVTLRDEDDHWNFSTIDPRRFDEAIRRRVCWVSGTPLGRWMSFVIGPMCLVNRVSGDPPVRREVAEWSVRICPFMSSPDARRVDRPEGYESQRGVMLERNPGVSIIYTTDEVQFLRSRVFRLGLPREVTFWSRGREATPEEVWSSVDSGLPVLREMAEAEGSWAVREFNRSLRDALRILPERVEKERE